MTKKRSFTPEYKAKIVIEVLEGASMANEIAAREKISPKQLSNWKSEFLSNAYKVFSASKEEQHTRKELKTALEREQAVMAKVGVLTIENDWLKKNLKKSLDTSHRMEMVGKHETISIKRQCELLELNRSTIYYKPKEPCSAKVERLEFIRNRIDYYHTHQCYLGAKKLSIKITREDGEVVGEDGLCIGRVGKKLVRRLMNEMGIYTIYPKPNLSRPGKEHIQFPYLLRNKTFFLPNQVWAVDITYIRMKRGHMYLTAIIDLTSRYIEKHGVPAIINSDQGSQFTSDVYIELLRSYGIRQSMNGKARWVDNKYIERWFRNLKCDDIYINEYLTPRELRIGIDNYINLYNNERPHQELNYDYPVDIYHYTKLAV